MLRRRVCPLALLWVRLESGQMPACSDSRCLQEHFGAPPVRSFQSSLRGQMGDTIPPEQKASVGRPPGGIQEAFYSGRNNGFFSMRSTSISAWIPLSRPPHPAELRCPRKEINLGPFHPQSHYFCQYTKVSVMGRGLRVNLLVNHIPAFESCAVFS